MDSNLNSNSNSNPRRNTSSEQPHTPPNEEAPPPYEPFAVPAATAATSGTPISTSARLRALTDLSTNFMRGNNRSAWSPSGGDSGGDYSPLSNFADVGEPDYDDGDDDDLDSPINYPGASNRQNRGVGIHLRIPDANPAMSGNHHSELSPASPNSPFDASQFQAAMAGFGMDLFDPNHNSNHNPNRNTSINVNLAGSVSREPSGRNDTVHTSSNERHLRQESIPSIVTVPDEPLNHRAVVMTDIPLTDVDDDSTPLSPHAAPIAGHPFFGAQTTPRPAHPSMPSSSRMLGDDLILGDDTPSPSRSPRSQVSRTLSSGGGVTSPLARSRTLLRHMSQRIVNMSNEQNVVEGIRRRQSEHKSQEHIEMDEVPSIPTFTDGDTGPEQPLKPLEPSNPFSPPPSPPLTPPSERTKNPFVGKSLGIISPDNKIRMWLCDILVHRWTEQFIFFLIVVQTVLLAIDSCRSVKYGDPIQFRFHTPIDYCLVGLFSIYTVEVITKIIVSGFILNPLEYSTISRQHHGWRRALSGKMQNLFGNPYLVGNPNISVDLDNQHQPSLLKSLATTTNVELKGNSLISRRARLAHRAYLRHSFNRLDFLSVLCYWISFAMQLLYWEYNRHLAVFRMISCLRIMRLLWLTNGTTVILRSLKKAAPLLVRVAFLIGFFWLLFAIIGVQSFKTSFSRQCTWLDPNDNTNNYTVFLQFCGGHLDNVTYQPSPWLYQLGNGTLVPGADSSKGYLCPVQSICLQQTNPYNGSVNFDNIFNSLELVFVVMTSNTFTDLMYYTTDSDYLAAALFFVFGTVILYFWMVNLLIAVITSSFQVIREESKTSAFTGENEDANRIALEEDSPVTTRKKRNKLKQSYQKTEYFWVLVITFGLLAQCLKSASMSAARASFISRSETFVTFILLLEIILRFLVDYRDFFKSKRNIADLIIAIITTVIQLPPIHSSGQPYAWLTFFQIIRIYRVVMAIPITKGLIVTMLGNFSGLLNLCLFVLMMTFLVGILATQIFRGSLPFQNSEGDVIRTQFFSLWNSMLGMYQILSSENWTDILYHITNFDLQYNTAWVGAIFFILWFILGNFIILNMFIAVIQENFDISEDDKRIQQVNAFLEQREPNTSTHGNLALSNIFRYGKISGRRTESTNPYGNNHQTENLLREAVVKDFLDANEDISATMSPNEDVFQRQGTRIASMSLQPVPNAVVRNGTASSLWSNLKGKLQKSNEPNPFYSKIKFSHDAAGDSIDPRAMAQHVLQTQRERRAAQRKYLEQHPSYNVSLFIFKHDNPVRKFCQKLVGPARGDRLQGANPSIALWYAFSTIIYMAIVAMVILACITTPLYQKEYFEELGYFTAYSWFTWCDVAFAVIFTAEAFIKIVADGFFFTPNAYYRSTWGFIDGVVLITLWINVSAALYNAASVARAVGAFKALRALRLLNISDSARENFHSVIIRMGVKVISAAFVSLSLLFPFAIYGLNLFSNKMASCNDGNSGIFDLNDCVGEFSTSSPFNWNVYAPRAAENSYYNFDNFGSSLFILFQIVSQEGWTDVMFSAQSITGTFTQPEAFKSQQYAVFFVVFNLLGAVFVLTLFISVFMRNYTEMTGVAFLTVEQRSWLELKKLLQQINPSKRSKRDKSNKWSKRFYQMAKSKQGWWQKFVTIVLILHLLLLCANFSPSPAVWDDITNAIFLFFTMVYLANIIIRILGLGFARVSRSSWDIYAMLAVVTTLVTSILVLFKQENVVFNRIQKLALTSITLLLIPRNNQLDQLFKTAAASLPIILNLMATWFVLYLTFAIALTQAFSLTRFGGNENGNLNLRDVPRAMILLFRMSSGEGWNQIMQDFANIKAPLCVEGGILNSDCGSSEWASFLFVAWNILSMYIFVNLFISLIYESFSYVYQASSGLATVSREEIRRLKEAWAVIDPEGTGYISKEALPKLLRELSGVFEMRIYDGDFSVKRIVEDCGKRYGDSTLSFQQQLHAPRPTEIDLAKLNARLKLLPVKEIRIRRARLRLFYEEVLVTAERDRGISFQSFLMILAHYKIIDYHKALRLNEFLRRRVRLQRVDESIRRQIVVGFFDLCHYRRKMRLHREHHEAGRMQTVPQLSVPEIYVEDENIESRAPSTDGYPSGASTPWEDIPSHTYGGLATPGNRSSIQISPPISPPSLSPHLSPQPVPDRQVHTRTHSNASAWTGRRPSTDMPHLDLSSGNGEFLDTSSSAVLTPDESTPQRRRRPTISDANRSRANSSVSVQGVLDALEQSAWGESMRRSFSVARPGIARSRSGTNVAEIAARRSGGRSNTLVVPGQEQYDTEMEDMPSGDDRV